MDDEKQISPDKAELLDALLNVYKAEVEVVYAVSVSWDQLKEEAKTKCVEDFDQAIVAREALLEELADLRDAGIIPNKHEFSLYTVDQHLLEQNVIVREIYGLDVNSFLNVKKPKTTKVKGLLKAKK